MADIRFKLSGAGETPARTLIRARGFDMIVDEASSLGGGDLGPNPLEYVLAGFAGCINFVGHLVAKEMGLEIRGIQFQVQGRLNVDRLYGRATADRTGFKEVGMSMVVDSDADDETLAEWAERVNARCPVSDNLSLPTPVMLNVQSARPEIVT